jgi:nucleotide-binding universal stress UspA family protein
MSTILVPSDFSKNANAALRYAIKLAKQIKSELLIFHCSHISAYALSAATSEAEMAKLLNEDEEHKMEKLQEQVTKAYKAWDINKIPSTTRCIVSYNPMMVEKTIEIARENNAGLIVMGTHGASGITKFFFGSNTSVMISKSPVPVLAIPEAYKYTPLETVVFASDLERFEAELARLLPFVKATNTKLSVIYLDYGLDTDSSKIDHAQEVIKQTGYKNIKLDVQRATLETSLVSQVKKYLARTKPECLVMFTRERSLWDRLFLKGSKTEDMSTAMAVPLLSFKKMN